MKKYLHQIFKFLVPSSTEEKRLAYAIHRIVGKYPKNLFIYKLAFSHTSASKISNNVGFRESNERLEYLGDAILGAVMADYLFKKYPFEDEGFLTEIRSRIVNRESLNHLAQKIGLHDLIVFDGGKRSKMAFKSMHGDALEALVGAVYLDRGYYFCYQFIVRKLIRPHYDLGDVITNNKNFKSVVIEWAQRENKELRFEIIKEKGSKHQKEFIAQLFIDDEPFSVGSGYSKKKAEQSSAEKACEMLKLNEQG